MTEKVCGPAAGARSLTEPDTTINKHRPLVGGLVIATHNPGKLSELRELLSPYGLETISAAELGLPDPEETGASFRANACIKARAAAAASGKAAFADDSGLAVEALGGQPGIYSARWAGAKRDFGRAMQKVELLLRECGATTPNRRAASFVSALCIAWPDGHVEEFEGRIHGTLVWPPRGARGFGYDPMFMPDGHSRTFGEMTAEEKHGLPPRGKALSHRARAFLELRRPVCAPGRMSRLSARDLRRIAGIDESVVGRLAP